MILGDFVTLECFKEEMLNWLKDFQEKCVPGGSWWDAQKIKLLLLGSFLVRKQTIQF